MKYPGIPVIITALCLLSFTVVAQSDQEKLDLPGDNFNLYAALKLFQESETLEGFEKSINDEATKINNLDLDGDNNIDYVKVTDNVEGDVHNIALKIAVNEKEDQDVAVFVVQKDKDGKVQIQVIGDEDLYGKDYIIEPNFEDDSNNPGATPNPGYTGNTSAVNTEIVAEKTTTAEIAAWPVIRFIYVPSYTIWRSPWHWGYYPPYWRPWKPFFWHYYYGYHYHWHYYYYGHYRRWPYYRFNGWHDHYYGGGFRSRSVFVENRYSRGGYKNTYTRPDLAKQGSAVFRRDFPKAPSANNKLPSFDKTGRPVVNRPAVTKPGTTRPVNPSPGTTRPGTTRPVITKPGGTSPARPITRPAKPAVTKPAVIRPRPVGGNKLPPKQGVTRPLSPANKKVTREPVRN